MLAPDGSEVAAQGVWTKKAGALGPVVRRFRADEANAAGPGQDARSVLDPTSLWAVLDLAPAGRGAAWHPTLDESAAPQDGPPHDRAQSTVAGVSPP